MSKIEPMSVERVKQLVFDHCAGEHAVNYECQWCCLIMGWAHERAQKNELEYELNGGTMPPGEDWLDPVLDEIGWSKEGR